MKKTFEAYELTTYAPSAEIVPPGIDLMMGPKVGGPPRAAELQRWFEEPWESVAVGIALSGDTVVLWRRRIVVERDPNDD